MNKKMLIPMAMLSLAITPWANAACTVTAMGSVGGAPTGVNYVNFDNLPLGSAAGAVASGPSGMITVTTAGGGSVVQGTSNPNYAAPFISGLNGAGFNNVVENGQDASPYLISGPAGAGNSVTLAFPGPQMYMGLLWGSVDASNELTFWNGAPGALGSTVVGTVTGTDVLNNPNGDQGVNGTFYVNITSTCQFTHVVATSGFTTFEFDNVAYNPTIPNCDVCVRTQGFWKNKGAKDGWPVQSLELGMVSYTKAQLLDILDTPVRGNGLISLSYQLIAAKLNIANGACVPAAVQTAITAADNLIMNLVVPPVGSGKIDPSLTSALTGILDAYNNGKAPGGPKHCK